MQKMHAIEWGAIGYLAKMHAIGWEAMHFWSQAQNLARTGPRGFILSISDPRPRTWPEEAPEGLGQGAHTNPTVQLFEQRGGEAKRGGW